MNLVIPPRILALAPLLASSSLQGATSFIEDFSSFTGSVSPSQAGGDQQQVVTSTVGTSQGGVAAIDGTSLFITIDTTNTPAVGSGSYGGGFQTTINPSSLVAGSLTSSNPADYNLVFDIAANGFSPVNMDIFLNLRNSTNDNVLPNQLNLNQNNSALASVITALGAGNGTVSVSLNLNDFGGIVPDVSALANAERFQLLLFSRAPDANYSDGAANVMVIDNVGIQQIPEPSSALLLGLASLGVLGRRSRA